MPKRYLFFYRNNSDIDHLSPVIYGLIKNGVDANLITYSDLWPHQSLIHCKRDPRLNYLKQLGVNVEQSEISMLYIHLYNFFLDLRRFNVNTSKTSFWYFPLLYSISISFLF